MCFTDKRQSHPCQTSDIICPKHFDCANAVGAAVARVSGEIDTIKSLLNTTFTLCVGPLKELAIKKAVEAGAKRDSVQIVEVQNLPVQVCECV